MEDGAAGAVANGMVESVDDLNLGWRLFAIENWDYGDPPRWALLDIWP